MIFPSALVEYLSFYTYHFAILDQVNEGGTDENFHGRLVGFSRMAFF